MYWVKKVSFTLFVLGLSFVIYTVVNHKNTFQDPVLKSSLDLLGKQLFAKMANDEKKEDAEKYYFNFIKELDKENVTEQEIEHFVTVALNFNTRDTIPSSSALLRELQEIPPPPPKTKVWVSSSDTNTIDVNLKVDLPDWRENRVKFAKRVQDLIILQNTVQDICKDSLGQLDQRPMVFARSRYGEGVSVNMHPRVIKIINRESQKIARDAQKAQHEWMKAEKRSQQEFEKQEYERYQQMTKLETLLVRLEKEKAIMLDSLSLSVPGSDGSVKSR